MPIQQQMRLGEMAKRCKKCVSKADFMAEFKFAEAKRVILKISFQFNMFNGLVKCESCSNHSGGNGIYMDLPFASKLLLF